MINEHSQKRHAHCDVLSITHIESSLIWIRSLKVECAIYPPSTKKITILHDATHMTNFLQD